jgi:hypothetical protein
MINQNDFKLKNSHFLPHFVAEDFRHFAQLTAVSPFSAADGFPMVKMVHCPNQTKSLSSLSPL